MKLAAILIDRSAYMQCERICLSLNDENATKTSLNAYFADCIDFQSLCKKFVSPEALHPWLEVMAVLLRDVKFK